MSFLSRSPCSLFCRVAAAVMVSRVELSSIPHSTRIVVLVGDSDEVVGNLGAIALLDQLLVPGIPDPNRRLEIVRSGSAFTASHLSVLETTPGARAAFWKRADRLIAAVRLH